jgi:tetratricopeptide (TPR) repeat protein
VKPPAIPSSLACCFLGATLLTATAARADNPTDTANAKLATRIVALGRSPKAVLPLLELWKHWDSSTPKQDLALLEKLATERRLSPAMRVLVGTLAAEGRTRMGDPDALDKGLDALGYLSTWRVIGPFDNEGKSGLDTDTPPETDRMLAPDLQASYPGRERPVSWRTYPESERRGYVSFGALLRPRENVCALAETFVYADRARPLALFFGSAGANKVYWNGQQVLRDPAYRMPSPDRSVVMVGARAGANRLLVKVCATTSSWGFHARLGEPDGAVAEGLRVQATSDEALDITPKDAPQKLPKAPPMPLAVFEAEAATTPPRAEALANLATYLRGSGSDDPAERRAQQLAAQAAQLAPSLDNILLAADMAEQRGDLMRFASKAEALFPDDPQSLLLRARVRASGPAPEEALGLLDRISDSSESWTAAQILRASVLHDLGLPLAALHATEQARAKVGDTPQVLRQLAQLYAAASAPDATIDAQKRLLAVRFDDIGAQHVLIRDALQRGATAEVLERLDALNRLSKGSIENLLFMASAYDGLGRDDQVLSVYREAMELAPESAEVLAAYGRTLLRADRSDLAIDALTRALAYKPQDAPTRELLEQVRPRPRDDEAYATTSEALLASRTDGTGYPSTVLTDLTVNTVFDNGLGSSFRQHAVQVHDKEGARNYRTYPIQYDPDSQRVEVRLARVYRKDGRVLESVRSYEQQMGEPWYRIYYDTRAMVIVFPELQPGDVVEIRFRVDDIAHRNLYADYYGDLHMWQGAVPIVQGRYVLITPATRSFHIHTPKMTGLEHTQSVALGRRIDQFTAKNIPAIVGEAGMPGLTEASPYMHISTYENWQDVAHWYWGLIKDQLYADESLKRTVRELTANATTTRQKVEKIHDWVVNNTRYVGLEFGIHGYMPYRVPLIVQRGFGDCKDKASLLYTMLREAGVEARMVLVRTRQNGAIVPEPASLAVFDHAIAYVPELDLFLDGTAEHSGTTELPVQDQGVTVLVFGPDGGELRQTPVLDADRSQRTRSLNVELAADGSATVEGQEEVTGAEAAGYREYYEAVGTRGERFERSLSASYPGLKLESQHFAALEDLEQPVRYNYRIAVPKFASWDGDELRLAPSTLDNLVQDLAVLPHRHHTLDLSGRRVYVEKRVVHLPTSLHAIDLPAGGEASSAFGSLKLNFSSTNGSITSSTEFRLSQDRIAPTEYPEYRRWIEAADQLLKQRIGLRKEHN